MAFSGKLSFNPLIDSIIDDNGKEFKFSPPKGDYLPQHGFESGERQKSFNLKINRGKGILFLTFYMNEKSKTIQFLITIQNIFLFICR